MTARSYVFTINNPEGDLKFEAPWSDAVRFCVWQKEAAPGTGTIHFQGYIELASPQRISFFKRGGGNWAKGHFEKRKGTREQAKKYAEKEESRLEGPWTWGTWETGGAGARSDLTGAIGLLKEKGLTAVAMEFPEVFVRNSRGLSELDRVVNNQKRDWPCDLFIFYGTPGSGKSRLAEQMAGEDRYYLRRGNSNNVWWDGYCGQGSIILDDFYGWIPFDLLLRAADRYECRVDIKGGSVQLLARKIFITSNCSWREWYHHPKLNLGALERRITHCLRLDHGEEPLWEKGGFTLPEWLGGPTEQPGEQLGGQRVGRNSEELDELGPGGGYLLEDDVENWPETDSDID